MIAVINFSAGIHIVTYLIHRREEKLQVHVSSLDALWGFTQTADPGIFLRIESQNSHQQFIEDLSMNTLFKQNPSNNFNLKNENVNLNKAFSYVQFADFSVTELEAMRVKKDFVPASKHGIETICGASCETGAQ